MEALNSKLTYREKEVLLGICKGEGNARIANNLNISPKTVEKHVGNIYRKIHVNNRFQAILWVSKNR